MDVWKDNITFVLVEPREAGNIGASARAMKNMGFYRLCLVSPKVPLNEEACWFARNALDVLKDARTVDAIGDAIADKAVVVGTTRRKGRRRGVFLNADEAAQRLFALARSNKVAILFGREDRGLFNGEVKECGFLLTIPSGEDQPSLNLSQAVMVVAYELSRAEHRSDTSSGARVSVPVSNMVDHKDLDVLFSRIVEVLRLLKYPSRGDHDLEHKIMHNLTHIIGRAGLTEWELKMLHGICSQAERRLSGGRHCCIQRMKSDSIK